MVGLGEGESKESLLVGGKARNAKWTLTCLNNFSYANSFSRTPQNLQFCVFDVCVCVCMCARVCVRAPMYMRERETDKGRRQKGTSSVE